MKEIQGDLFAHLKDHRMPVIAHGCNTQGVMGAGFARQLKERYPTVAEIYKESCQEDEMPLGEIQTILMEGAPMIINMMTQPAPGPTARLEWIEKALKAIDKINWPDDFSFLAPRIGCGLGGLDWKDVRPLFEQTSIDWTIYYLEEA